MYREFNKEADNVSDGLFISATSPEYLVGGAEAKRTDSDIIITQTEDNNMTYETKSDAFTIPAEPEVRPIVGVQSTGQAMFKIKPSLPPSIQAKEIAKFTVPAGISVMFVGNAGSESSSTASYVEQAYGNDLIVTPENINRIPSGTVILTSVEGRRTNRISPVDGSDLSESYEAIKPLLDKGSILRTDHSDAKSTHNIGEKELTGWLKDNDYVETQFSTGYSEWVSSNANIEDVSADNLDELGVKPWQLHEVEKEADVKGPGTMDHLVTNVKGKGLIEARNKLRDATTPQEVVAVVNETIDNRKEISDQNIKALNVIKTAVTGTVLAGEVITDASISGISVVPNIEDISADNLDELGVKPWQVSNVTGANVQESDYADKGNNAAKKDSITASFGRKSDYIRAMLHFFPAQGTVGMHNDLMRYSQDIDGVQAIIGSFLAHQNAIWGVGDEHRRIASMTRLKNGRLRTSRAALNALDRFTADEYMDIDTIQNIIQLMQESGDEAILMMPSEFAVAEWGDQATEKEIRVILTEAYGSVMSSGLISHIAANLKKDFDTSPVEKLKDFVSISKYTRHGTVVKGHPNHSNFIVPATVVKDYWSSSAAKNKLIKNGRNDKELDPDELVKSMRTMYDNVYAKLNKISAVYDGLDDGIGYQDNYIPHRPGRGYLGANYKHVMTEINVLIKQKIKEHTDESLDSYTQTIFEMRHSTTDTDVRRRSPGSYATSTDSMLSVLSSLLNLGQSSSELMLRRIESGQANVRGLHKDSTYLDVALKINQLAKEKAASLHSRGKSIDVVLDGTNEVNLVTMLAAQKRLFKRLNLKESSRELMPRKYDTYLEAYDATGMMPESIGALNALGRYSSEVLTATAKRVSLNRMIAESDSDGALLVIPDPILTISDDRADQIILPETWTMVLERAVAHHGFRADPAKTTKENVGAFVQETRSNKMYKEVPADGLGSIDRFLALGGLKGEENIFDMFSLGTAPSILRQLVDGKYRDPYGVIKSIEQVNSWSKQASLIGSFFFHKAGLESVTAGTGGRVNAFRLDKLFGNSKENSKPEEESWKALSDMIRSDDPSLMAMYSDMADAGIAMNTPDLFFGTNSHMDSNTFNKVIGKVDKKNKAAARGLMEIRDLPSKNSAFTFGTVFAAGKLMLSYNFVQLEQKQHFDAGGTVENFDRVQALTTWSEVINGEMGGHKATRYTWMTPKVQQILSDLNFSFPWTFAAWNAAGGGLLTGRFMGNAPTPTQAERIMTVRWPIMLGLVMMMEPMVMQAVIYGITRVGGGDEPESYDDKWLSLMNETGKKGSVDITPIVRKQRWFRKNVFGTDPSKDKRRYYVRYAKQAYEIKRWFDTPFTAAMGKTSPMVHSVYELFTGRHLGMPDWSFDFKDEGAFSGWVTSDEGFLGSRSGYVVQKFLPFSILAGLSDPDKFIAGMSGSVSKGVSAPGAIQNLEEVLHTWADNDSFDDIYANRRAKVNLEAIGYRITEDARRNGFNAETILKTAKGKAMKPYYTAYYKAVVKGDQDKAEKAARSLHRLNAVLKNLMSSVKTKSKYQYREYTPEMKEFVRESFQPYKK
jgi:hypothetical protein